MDGAELRLELCEGTWLIEDEVVPLSVILEDAETLGGLEVLGLGVRDTLALTEGEALELEDKEELLELEDEPVLLKVPREAKREAPAL